MRALKKFVEDNKYKYPSKFGYTFDEFLKVNGVTEDTVTEDMMNWYTKHLCDKQTFSHPAVFSEECMQLDNYITEMLKTTSINVLIKQLNSVLGSNKNLSVKLYTEEDFGIKQNKDVRNVLIPKDLYNKEKIEETCEKMMWQWTLVRTGVNLNRNPSKKWNVPFFTKYDNYGNTEYALITVEPLNADKRTIYVQDYCDGILYHLCKKDNTKKILQSGLRMKGENNSYRFIKNRVYFICSPDKEDLKLAIKRVALSKGYWDYENETIKENISILKVDVSDYNIDFYCDKMYAADIQDNIVYAFGYFPPKMIKEINYKSLFK